MTYKTTDNINFLARTMDFSIDLEAAPIFIPRAYHFNTIFNKEGYETKYGFLGAGRKLNEYIFTDGFNEKGFGIEVLYFHPKAKYSETPADGKINLDSSELVTWSLSNIASVQEFKEKLGEINLVNNKNILLQKVVPLHWIISDATGETVVLEVTETGYHLYENKVGVMTNSPEFTWHLDNLAHYNHIQPTEAKEKKYGDYVAAFDGPGFGALGLPGDYTSASRFIRVAFLREYIEPVSGELSGVKNISKILNSVDIPKGVKINAEGNSDYTQYIGIMDLNHLKYYFTAYNELSPKVCKMTETMLNEDKIISF